MALAAARTNRRPQVNAFDLPELLPGAQPSANPAQREHFEETCRKMYQQELEDEAASRARRLSQPVAGAAAPATEHLEAMFPTLEPALVRMLVADAQSPEHAVEMLLALAASMEEDSPNAAPVPERNLLVTDGTHFPVLVNSQGWEVIGSKQLEADEQDLGSAWCDRAKDAIELPAPVPRARPAAAITAQARRRGQDSEKQLHADALSDYDLRQLAGQRRAGHLARRRQRARGAGARPESVEVPADSTEENGHTSEIDLEKI